MDDSIRRVGGASGPTPVRRVVPQQMKERDESFEEELKNRKGKKEKKKDEKPSTPAPTKTEERAVSPPSEDDIGSHLDLSG